MMTQKEVLRRVKGLTGEVRRQTICGLIGHSKIATGFMFYIYCARCGDMIADSLAGDPPEGLVVADHGKCKHCKKNMKKLTWRDTLCVPSKDMPHGSH